MHRSASSVNAEAKENAAAHIKLIKKIKGRRFLLFHTVYIKVIL